MLQRQVVFKQLHELQQRQQLQEISDSRNQNFINQLSSLKQASVGQSPAAFNGGTPTLDSSQMYIFGNWQMMQQGGSNGLPLSPNRNHDAVDPCIQSQQQFDVSYGTRAAYSDKNLNQYSRLQGQSDLSVGLWSKSNDSLGVATMQPSAFGGSFQNQQCNFSSYQDSIQNGSWLSNQDKDLYGQVTQIPIEGFNRGNMFANYYQQGVTMQRHESFLESNGWRKDSHWDERSQGKTSNVGLSDSAVSLDPLEQKILFGTDDNAGKALLSRSGKVSTGGFKNTVELVSDMDVLQSGSWSALMQSAVAETCSRNPGIREEWSGLSFKNPELINHNHPTDSTESEKLQNNCIDRNSQHATSSSGPNHLFQNSYMNYSFPSLQESGHKYGYSHAFSEHFPGNSAQFTDYSSQQKLPMRGTQLIHTPLSSTVSSDPGFALEPTDPQTTQAYSFFPMLESFTATTVSGNNVNDYTSNQHQAPPVARPVATEFSERSTAATLPNSELKINHSSGQEFAALENTLVTQPTVRSVVLQRAGLSSGLPTPWQDITAHKPCELFAFPDLASSSLGVSSRAPVEHPSPKSSAHEQQLMLANTLPDHTSEKNSISHSDMHTQDYVKYHCLEAGPLRYGSLTSPHQQLSNQVKGTGNETHPIPDLRHTLSQNHSLQHQLHSSGNAEIDGAKSFVTEINNGNNQKSILNARELFITSQKSGAEGRANSEPFALSHFGAFWAGNNKYAGDESGRASSTACLQKQVDICQKIGQQKAPSCFKHYGTLNNGEMLPTYEPKSADNAGQPVSDSQQISSNMQVNLASSTAAAFKQLDSPSVLPSDITYQKLNASMPKKRKLVMLPWHKEMNEPWRLQDISTAELAWAQALNRRAEQAKDEVEEFLPLVWAKRRVVCTMQFMQQVFRPLLMDILRSDASASCDYIPYSMARLTLGEACNLIGQLPFDATDTLSDKLKTIKRRKAFESSKAVEGFIKQAKKLEDDLSALDRSISYAAVKLESLELEKFSMINRFAKTHIKAVDPASSSSTSTLPKTNIQRYVVALPMPRTVPEGIDCLPL